MFATPGRLGSGRRLRNALVRRTSRTRAHARARTRARTHERTHTKGRPAALWAAEARAASESTAPAAAISASASAGAGPRGPGSEPGSRASRTHGAARRRRRRGRGGGRRAAAGPMDVRGGGVAVLAEATVGMRVMHEGRACPDTSQSSIEGSERFRRASWRLVPPVC